MPTSPAQGLLSVEELASYLGMPTNTIYKWNSAGEGPRRIKIGRVVRYRLADVEAWLKEHEV